MGFCFKFSQEKKYAKTHVEIVTLDEFQTELFGF